MKSVPVGSNSGVLLVSPDDGPTLIINSDVNNTIYLGKDSSVSPSNLNNSVPLSPQSYLVVAGDQGDDPVYAVCNAGETANVYLVPGGLSFFQSGITSGGFRLNSRGLFIYSSVIPAFGTLVASIAPFAGVDPVGNVYLAGDTSYSASGVINENGGVTLVYAPTAALGNLIASDTPTTGVDSFGNVYKAGIATYQIGTGIFSDMLSGALVFGKTGSGFASNPSLGTDSGGQGLVLNSASNAINNGTEIALELATVTIQKQAGGTGGVTLLDVEGPVSAKGSITALVAAFNGAFSALRSGDTVNRWSVDSDGDIAWGNGGSAQDSVLYRAGAGLLAVSILAADVAGSAETWHSLGALGAHYTVNFGRYKKSPDNFLEYDINVTGDGLQANTVTFANTLPVAYRPVATHAPLPLGSTRAVNAGDIWPRLSIDSAGNVSVTAQPINGISYGASGRIPLD